MPTKSPGLMSSTDALATPAIFQPGASISVAFGPSRVFTEASIHRGRRPSTHPDVFRRLRRGQACASKKRQDRNGAAEGRGNFDSCSTLHDGLSKSELRRPTRSTGVSLRYSAITVEATGLFGGVHEFIHVDDESLPWSCRFVSLRALTTSA